MQLRATLFDMDGLLLDSEILWHKAEREIFGNLGVTIPSDGPRATKGMYVAEVVAYWFEQSPWTGPSQAEVVASILSRVGDLVESEGVLMSGALRALDVAAARGPIALASSTPMALIERCLDHFSLRSHFRSLHSAEIEPYGKPHPGVFLSAARALETDPRACLVFEDSGAGLLAAKAGRMTCVAVPAPDDRADAVFALADLCLDDLADLAEAWLDERFGVGA